MLRGREFQSKVSHQSGAFAPPYHQARVHHSISKKCRCLHQDTRAHTHPRPSTRDARFKDSQADYIPHAALPFPPRNHHSVQVARPLVYKSPYLEIKIWSPYTCLGPHDTKTLGCFVMHVSSMSQVDPLGQQKHGFWPHCLHWFYFGPLGTYSDCALDLNMYFWHAEGHFRQGGVAGEYV